MSPIRRSLNTSRSRVHVKAFFNTKKDEDELGGFVFDPSMQRWVRAPNKKADKSMMTVTPLSGSPYVVWPVMHSYLSKRKLQSIDQDTALSLMKKGAILVDVRLSIDYKDSHAAGALNVPLFRLTAGDSNWDQVKKVVMAGLNMRPTERDPNFFKNAEKVIGNKRKKLILMCSVGGTLDTVVRVASTGKKTETDKDRAFGRESRSLKACYELMKGGWQGEVLHLKGGLGEWRYQGYPTEP